MTRELDDPADAIIAALIATSELFEAVSARCLAAVDASITMPQFRVLLRLSSEGAANLATLARALDVQPSTIGRMIERLVAAGLIDRRNHPTSRRELVVDLNVKGHQIVDDVVALRREQFNLLIQTMPATLQKNLLAGLTALSEACGNLPAVYAV